MHLSVLLLLICAPMLFGATEPWSLAIMEAAVLGLFARRLLSPEPLAPTSAVKPVIVPLLCVAGLGALQLLRQHPADGAVSLLPFTAWRPATVNAIARWLAYAAFVWLVTQAATGTARVKQLLYSVFIGGVVVALLGMCQKDLIFRLRGLSADMPFGPYLNRDNAANYLLLAFMAGVGLFASRLVRLRHRVGKPVDTVALAVTDFLMMCVVGAGVVETGSRGGTNALAASSWLVLFLSSSLLEKRAARIAAKTMLCAAGAVYVLMAINHRYFAGIDNNGVSATLLIRVDIYKSTLALIRDFPLFGSGLGTYSCAFPYYQGKLAYGLVEHAHNDWLEILAETGVAGLLAYGIAMALVLRGALRKWRRAPDPEMRAMMCGVTGGLCAFMVHSCADFGLQIPANALAFYLFCALPFCLPAGVRNYAEPQWAPADWRRRALALCALPLLWVCLAQGAGWYYAARGLDASGADRPALLEKAIGWQRNPRYLFLLGATYYNQSLHDAARATQLRAQAAAVVAPYGALLAAHPDIRRLNRALSAASAAGSGR